jgi:hypothetical protein
MKYVIGNHDDMQNTGVMEHGKHLQNELIFVIEELLMK